MYKSKETQLTADSVIPYQPLYIHSSLTALICTLTIWHLAYILWSLWPYGEVVGLLSERSDPWSGDGRLYPWTTSFKHICPLDPRVQMGTDTSWEGKLVTDCHHAQGSCMVLSHFMPKTTGADFTKGLKSRFRLKFKTLVLNFVNILSVVLDLVDFTKQVTP